MLFAERLVAARASNRVAEFAAEVAASGNRSDIVDLLKAIVFAEAEEKDILSRSLQALNNASANDDLRQFLISHAEDQVAAVQVRDALARNATSDDIPQLAQMLPADPEQGLARSYLLGTISRVSAPATIPELADLCILTKDLAVYTAAAVALGAIADPEAVSSLVGIIQERSVTDINDPVAQALMSAANKDSRLLLQDEFLNTTNPVIQYATAYALASLSNQASGVRSGPPPGQP